jgi:exosortase
MFATSIQRVRETAAFSWEVFYGALGAFVLLWIFWPTLAELANRWGADARYSHGYLVPVFSLYLLWARRDALAAATLRPSWMGLPVLVAGLGMHFAGTYLYVDWLSAMALLPCVAGLILLVGGWRILGLTWPAVAFLAFMVPLPFRLEVALAHPLQRVATKVSTYALQTLGFVVFSEGNVIRMGEVHIGVVEACAGLSMLVIFFALSTAVSLVIKRRWPVKLLIVLSAVPIALIANITRITVTAILHKTVGSELADFVFHDLAGWLMMPLALGFLWIELRLLAWVILPPPSEETQPIAFTWTTGAIPAAPSPIKKPAPPRVEPPAAVVLSDSASK